MSDGFTRLAGIAGGYVEARIMQAAVGLGVFDALRDQETADAAAVAAAIGAEARATGLLLDALAVMGLLDKDGPRYRLNDLSTTYLLSASPRDFGGMIRFDALLWDAWGKLEEAVRTGRPARSPDMYQNEETETGIFIEAMDSLVKARRDADVMTAALDLGNARRLLDIGPGPATYPIALCRRYTACGDPLRPARDPPNHRALCPRIGCGRAYRMRGRRLSDGRRSRRLRRSFSIEHHPRRKRGKK